MSNPISDDGPHIRPDSADVSDDDVAVRDQEVGSGGSTELEDDDADLAGSAFPPDNSFGQVPDFDE